MKMLSPHFFRRFIGILRIIMFFSPSKGVISYRFTLALQTFSNSPMSVRAHEKGVLHDIHNDG